MSARAFSLDGPLAACGSVAAHPEGCAVAVVIQVTSTTPRAPTGRKALKFLLIAAAAFAVLVATLCLTADDDQWFGC
jgi:trans-2-enoyl-CoA reductase